MMKSDVRTMRGGRCCEPHEMPACWAGLDQKKELVASMTEPERVALAAVIGKRLALRDAAKPERDACARRFAARCAEAEEP